VTDGATKLQQQWQDLARRLEGWFERRTGNLHDAHDLVQETFLRVQARFPELRDPERFAAWAAAIAANVHADHARRQARRRVRAGGEGEQALSDLPAPEAGDENLNGLVAGWIASFLEELDADDAALLRAVELEGRSQADVARELGLSPSGARSRVQRARERLRARLEACCRFAFDEQGNVLGATRRGAASCGCS
jgi:RNA polymerase sigma-70 factor (ECF subfamily)